MKKTLLLALALIAVGCGGPNPRNLDELSTQGRQYLDPETLEPYSGRIVVFFPDESSNLLRKRGTLKEGYWHGSFEEYGLNGNVVYRGEAYMGDGCGEWINPSTGVGGSRYMMNPRYWETMSDCPTWWENANDWMRERDGNQRWYRNYATSNDPFSENVFWKAVLFHDLSLRHPSNTEGYHENGQLGWKVSVRYGENDGPYESYDEDGQLWEKGTYNMSERCGEWIEDGETVTYPSCPPPLPDVLKPTYSGLVTVEPFDWDSI